jgi:hypothetical protein
VRGLCAPPAGAALPSNLFSWCLWGRRIGGLGIRHVVALGLIPGVQVARPAIRVAQPDGRQRPACAPLSSVSDQTDPPGRAGVSASRLREIRTITTFCAAPPRMLGGSGRPMVQPR